MEDHSEEESVDSPPLTLPEKSSTTPLGLWRRLCIMIGSIGKICSSSKKREAVEGLPKTQIKLRTAGLVVVAAHQLLQGAKRRESEEAKRALFGISAGEASLLVLSRTTPNVPFAEEVARQLCTSIDNGISSDTRPTLSTRQKIFGLNVYDNKPKTSFWTFLRDHMFDTTIMILVVCSTVSMGVQGVLEGWPEGSYDGLAIISGVFLIAMMIAGLDYKQYLLSEDFTKQKKVSVMRDGKRQNLHVQDILVGDVVFLSSGVQIPADGMYISGHNVLVDESSISGESTEPVTVNEENFRLLGGTKVQDGSGVMLVVSVGMRTYMGRLMKNPSQSGEKETPILKKISGICMIMVAISLFFSLVALLVQELGILTAETFYHEPLASTTGVALTVLKYVSNGLSVYVVGVPAGMLLTVKLYLYFAGMQLKKKGALVKHLSSCETMASVSNICSDKTGTLTTNHIVVNKFMLCGEVICSHAAVEVMRSAIDQRVSEILLQSVFLNNCSEFEENSDGMQINFGRPTELALLKFGLSFEAQCANRYRDFKKLQDLPYDSRDKIRSALVECPEGGNRVFCTGAADIVLQLCTNIVTSNGESLHLSVENREVVLDIINGFCHEALRTLCLAFKDLDPSDVGIPNGGYTLIAVVGVTDLLRPNVKDVVQRYSDAGITVRMVTGDSINTAKAIAIECGILKDGGLAIEGQALHAFGPEELKLLIPQYQVFASCSPEDKRTVVFHLKNASAGVAVVGDGTSDALMLHEADIGLAMGVVGTEAAKEGADVIILDDDFTTILYLAKWGRAVYMNIRGFLQLKLTANAVALAVNFLSVCYLGFRLLPPVLLLWVNLILDTSFALASATEPTKELRNQPPVIKGERLITKTMWRNIIGQIFYQSAILMLFIFYGKSLLRLEGPGGTDILNTFILYTFVFCQVFNVMTDQVVEKMDLRNIVGGGSNWKVTAITISKTMLPGIFVLLPPAFADTVPLTWQLWLLSIFVGSLSMVIAFLLNFIPM